MSSTDENGTLILAADENYIPTGLPGGFFIYNAHSNEEILFAEENIIKLFGCENIADFRAFTKNSFRGMVHPDDYEKIQNDIQSQTFTSEKLHDYVRYRIITKSGEIRYVEDFGHLLHGAHGQSYFYVFILDVDKDEGYEALARWKDPKFGMLSPADFIETLEQFHLIHKVDCFVIKKVCEDYCALQTAGEPLVPVSINLSRLDFELCNILETVERYRSLYGVPREMLDLEITESALNEKNDLLKNEIKRFRDCGYQIWIDDFGSGYSSLNTLMDYDFDVLKLDMEFLRTYDKNPRTGNLLNYIVYAAVEMGVQPLTEGVETQEHAEFLRGIGCDKAQGYYFGKPMPMEETRTYTRDKGMKWETVSDR